MLDAMLVGLPKLFYLPGSTPATIALSALTTAARLFGPVPTPCFQLLHARWHAMGSPPAVCISTDLFEKHMFGIATGFVAKVHFEDLSAFATTVSSECLFYSAVCDRSLQLARPVSRKWRANALSGGHPRLAADMDSLGVDPRNTGGVTAQANDPQKIEEGLHALMSKLSPRDLEQMLQFWRSYHLQKYRVGTMFSGTDVAIVAFQKLFRLLKQQHGIDVTLVHEMSVESHPRKRSFLLRHFPSVKAMFGHSAGLSKKFAVDVRTGKAKAVPVCLDHFVAGWPCKLHSVENMSRSDFGNALTAGVGSSGQAYQDMKKYIQEHKPLRLLLENVQGLLFRTRAKNGHFEKPQVHVVMRDLRTLGFAASFERVSSHFFLQPVRRNRVYIAAERKLTGHPTFAASEFGPTVQSMRGLPTYPLDAFLESEAPETKLTVKQQGRLKRRLSTHPHLATQDSCVDVGKTFADFAVDMLTCPRPSSKPYLLKRRRIVTGLERMHLQGIWEGDFPGLQEIAKERGGNAFLADLAGNSFTLHTCAAALIAQVAHCRVVCEHAPLRAISIKSPLIMQCILNNLKNVENRSWALTPGWYILHLSSVLSSDYAKPKKSLLHGLQEFSPDKIDSMRGRLVGFCWIDAGQKHASQNLAEACMGPWANVVAGQYQHRIRHAAYLNEMHQTSGSVGVWRVSQHIAAVVRQDVRFIAAQGNFPAPAGARVGVGSHARAPRTEPHGKISNLETPGSERAVCGNPLASWDKDGRCARPDCLHCWPMCPGDPDSTAKRKRKDHGRVLAAEPDDQKPALPDQDGAVLFSQDNPKLVGSSAHARYEKYKSAKSIREALALSAAQRDIANDWAKGFISVSEQLARPTHRLRSKLHLTCDGRA
jgi:site-specific DNA-cytosine methylase